MRENGRQKFVELANKRVNKALKDIQLIGNLSNRSNYSYLDEDVKQIFRVLETELRECRRKFEQKGAVTSDKFHLE